MISRFARKEGQRGFTLIELLIVMALLGVLVAVLLPKYQDLTPEAKIAATQQHLETLRSAVLLYTSKNYNPIFPPSLEALVDSGFVRKMPAVKISGLELWSDAATIPGTANDGKWHYATSTGEVRCGITNITTFISSYSGSVNPWLW